jgi:hypothetical protein
LSPQEVVANLHKREKYIPANSWLAAYHHILVDGWKLYAKSGGTFSFPPLSIQLLRDLLNDSPYLLMVNSTYLNQSTKYRYNKDTDKFDPDPIRGRSLTHALTCAGYKDGSFLIVDPDPPTGTNPHRWIAGDHLIASIMSAQTESDNFLITIQK